MKNHIVKVIKHWVLGDRLPCYVISREPLICIAYWEDYAQYAAAIATALPPHRPVYFLFQLGWHRETPERAQLLRDEVGKYAHPAIKFIFLTNSLRESELLDECGIRNEFIHQNAFVDEQRYRIIRCRKEYDAIYIARITPFKRHQLAAAVPRLKLVGDHSPQETEYFEGVMRLLAHADWTRKVFGWNVSRAIAPAHTGLCLSAEEGAMFVSIEYLLSGCPIVSTQNLGGRAAFFQDDYAAMVEDTPEAVAEGVDKMIRRHPDPEFIRRQTIAKMEEFRSRFIALIQKLYDQENVRRQFVDEWQGTFVHKFGLRCPTWTLPRQRFLYPHLPGI